GSSPSLYLIDTSNDSNTNIDSGNATFSLVGWSGHNFVYTVERNGYSPTQANGEALKSYNAETNQLITLDQTASTGNDNTNWAHETYADGQVYLEGSQVVYVKQWDFYQGLYVNYPTLLDGKQDGIYTIGADGKNAQTLHSFSISLTKYTTLQSFAPKPNQIDFAANDPSGISYYSYENGKVSDQSDLSKQFNGYYQTEITYQQSPSGDQTFWTEPRDGKNTLFIGDQNGGDGKQIATLSDYSPYGWYTDNYLLVQKDDSELYAMPVS